MGTSLWVDSLRASTTILRERRDCLIVGDLGLTRLPRAVGPQEAAISDALASLRDWDRVARADCVTLVLGAVCNPHAWWNGLRGGACRNPGQGNSGGQDQSDEAHGGPRFGSVQPRHAESQSNGEWYAGLRLRPL